MEYTDGRSQRSPRGAGRPHGSRPHGGQGLSHQASGSRGGHGGSSRPRQQRPLGSAPHGRGRQRGYELRNRSIGFASAGRGKRSGGPDARMIAALVLGIVAVVLLVFAISSCVSNNAAQEQQTEEKPRVATGISDSLSQALTARLDQDDQIAQVASNADQYPDERLVEMVELPRDVHPWFVATQAHPEFKSRPTNPQPLFREFVRASIGQHEGVDRLQVTPMNRATD